MSTRGASLRSLEIRHGGGEHPPAVEVVAAVEPELAALRARAPAGAPGRGAAAGPAIRRGVMPASKAELSKPREAGRAQRRDRRAGIDELVAPDEPRARQVEEPVLVLVDEAAALLVDGEILRRRRGPARRRRPRGLLAQHRVGLRVILRRDHGRSSRA